MGYRVRIGESAYRWTSDVKSGAIYTPVTFTGGAVPGYSLFEYILATYTPGEGTAKLAYLPWRLGGNNTSISLSFAKKSDLSTSSPSGESSLFPTLSTTVSADPSYPVSILVDDSIGGYAKLGIRNKIEVVTGSYEYSYFISFTRPTSSTISQVNSPEYCFPFNPGDIQSVTTRGWHIAFTGATTSQPIDGGPTYVTGSGIVMIPDLSIDDFSWWSCHVGSLVHKTEGTTATLPSNYSAIDKIFSPSSSPALSVGQRILVDYNTNYYLELFIDGLIVSSNTHRLAYPIAIEYSNLPIGQDYFSPEYPEGPYGPGGASGPGGGDGTFGEGEVSDDIVVDLPEGSTDGDDTATGMYTRYLVNSSYLGLIGDWVWDPNLGLSLVQTALKPFFDDPSESLISMISFPFSIAAPIQGVGTTMQSVKFGHTPVPGATFPVLNTGSGWIDWGSISIAEYWGNFLDYSPHTKIELYLPWGTGFVTLDNTQVMGKSISVRTNIEFMRGSCVHNVYNSDGCVIGSYAGQCGKQVPLLSSDIAAKRAGLVTAAVATVVGGAAGALTGAASHAAGQAAGTAVYSNPTAAGIRPVATHAHGAARRASINRWSREVGEAADAAYSGAYSDMSTKMAGGAYRANKLASQSAVAALKSPASVARNGGFTDGSAGMGIQYPFIIVSRPDQNVPDNYGHHFGYPSNIYRPIALLNGYTEIGSIHLDGIPATEGELAELDSILKGGVIL